MADPSVADLVLLRAAPARREQVRPHGRDLPRGAPARRRVPRRPTRTWPAPPRGHRGLPRRAAGPLEACHGRQPLPGPAGLLRLAGGRGRDPHRPDGQDAAATVPDQPVPGATEDALRRLLEACAGRDFEARRDGPDPAPDRRGPRRAEIAGMRLGDLDFEYDVVRSWSARAAGSAPAVRHRTARPSTATSVFGPPPAC